MSWGKGRGGRVGWWWGGGGVPNTWGGGRFYPTISEKSHPEQPDSPEEAHARSSVKSKISEMGYQLGDREEPYTENIEREKSGVTVLFAKLAIH